MGVTFTSHAAVAIHSFALKQPHVQSTVQRKTLGLCFSHKYLDTFADKYTCMRGFFSFIYLDLRTEFAELGLGLCIMYFKLVAAEGGTLMPGLPPSIQTVCEKEKISGHEYAEPAGHKPDF